VKLTLSGAIPEVILAVKLAPKGAGMALAMPKSITSPDKNKPEQMILM
jgi:hypothetical protein